MNYTHLHVHTQFSILDGASEIKTIISRAKEYGMNALAITDHGNMYGVLKFSEEAKKQGIKPIIGCEVYVAEGSRFEKKGKEDRSGFHLILIAKNQKGYRNLSKLCSLGFLEGFYYTPRVDKELLKQYSEGLIASSACLGGEIPVAAREKNKNAVIAAINEYKSIFGDDFYLELQRHGLPEQDIVNKVLIELAVETNTKLIATNDVHFVDAKDAEAHDILVCLNTGKDFNDINRMKYSGNEYLKSIEEMQKLFSDVPEAISNTQEIVDKVEEINIKRKDILLPTFPLPEGFKNEDEYLEHLTFEGAKKWYPNMDEPTKERLDFELSVIKTMGFAGYFLIVQDFINQARKMNVAVGPGRGSAAGSAVAFCIGITSVDPIKYKLLFERFLNPERISMPDIDVDFDDDGRQKVIDYVIEKYGKSRVAQIVTFGTMAAKSSIKDVARVLQLPLSDANRLTKLVPDGVGVTLEKSYAEVKELSDALKGDNPLVSKVLNFAQILEGSARHTGTHACGVIIGPEDLIEYIPLCTSKDSELAVTQYDGKYVESVGMLKMDFLGLKTLSIIIDAIENIRLRHNITIDIDTIPLDDAKTFELYQKGETVGTFQFESDGMRAYLKDLKPTNIEDLIAMNALYRPGPMSYIPTFINRKQGREKTEYPHPLLEGILADTYGIMVYQEQIMQTAQVLAGYSLGSADVLRRAMGKKQKDVMEKQKQIFIDGAHAKGIDKTKAEEVFSVMEKFAEYGFNRSHSAAYSLVAYQTAYLKAHYPAEYMAAVLTHNLNDIKKITFFMDECKRQNIPVLGPDVNESAHKFTVNKKGAIRFGLGAIKGVGEAAVEHMILERKKGGHFKNIFEMTKRLNLRTVNKRSLEALAMSGAFDSFPNTHRAQYFAKEGAEEANFIDKIIKHTNNNQSKQDAAQHSLFGESSEVEIPDIAMPECPKWNKIELLEKEKETTGIYLSGHPLDDYIIEINQFCTHTLADIKEIDDLKNKEISVAGIVSNVSHKSTKTGNPYGSFVLEDYSDSHTFTLFSEKYVNFKGFLEPGYFVHLKGKVENRYKDDDQFELKISSMNLLAEMLDKNTNTITLILDIDSIDDEVVQMIKKSINTFKGKCKLKVSVVDFTEKIQTDLFSKKITIQASGFLKEVLKNQKIRYKIN